MIKSELLLDKVRSLTLHDIETGKMFLRLTQLEESSLSCTAEGEEIVDAIGALITTLYRAKKATFSATNSLFHTGLLAAQYGTQVETATADNKITDYTYEVLTVVDGKVTIAHAPKDAIKYIYSIANNEVGTAYEVATEADDTHFSMAETVITVPTGMTGKVYVEYNYESENAIKISNKGSQFPTMCSAIIYAYFKDKCNDNIVYSGKVIAQKAKLNPEQVEISMTSTGKHPFELQFLRDYCDEENDELFSVIVAE